MDRIEEVKIAKLALYELMLETFKEVSEALDDKPVSKRSIFDVVLKAKADHFLVKNEQILFEDEKDK